MNIYDIAKKAGVSPSTVSRVINHNENVSEKSKKRVQEVMQQEGYIPNVFARGLNLNSIKTVGILCPVIDDLNHARAVAMVEHQLRDNGFDSLLCCTGSNLEDKEKYLTLFLNKRVDAIVVIGSTMEELEKPQAFESAAKRVPILIINGLVRCPNVYCVLCDEEAAMIDMVHKLHERGHERIVYLTDSPTYSAHQKLSGYQKGLRACGLEEDSRLILRIPDNGKEGAAAMERLGQLIASGTAFSAVMACDDTVAIGALKALRAHHMDIPVVGFNNSDFAFYSSPALSSIDNRMSTLAKSAIDILMNVFSGEDAISRIMISARFVERESFRL